MSSKGSNIPQVDKVLRHPQLVEIQKYIARKFLAEIARNQLDQCRTKWAAGLPVPDADIIVQSIVDCARQLSKPALKRLINATGVILNTNLGRAPIAQSALEQLCSVGSGYCNLELDLSTGKRGQRDSCLEMLLHLLTGSEAAVVVNNNAAAVLLAVNTFARQRQVIVSRGELIEIGGSFRLPEVIVSAGSSLSEVGTTNRTRLSDYQNAITPASGLILKCHKSNFEMRGFTEEVSLAHLVALANETGIPLLEDLGSGCLLDLSAFGFAGEPTVQSCLETGVDLVSFSADKLLGGPQAGIIAGKKTLVERLRCNPLYRALRVDKLTLSALEMVLRQYMSPQPEHSIPCLQMLSTSVSELKSRAESFACKAGSLLTKIQCLPQETASTSGGGCLPDRVIPSYGIALVSSLKAHQMAGCLRLHQPAVIAVIKEDKTILDLRTVQASEEEIIMNALIEIDNKIAQ